MSDLGEMLFRAAIREYAIAVFTGAVVGGAIVGVVLLFVLHWRG